MCLANHKWKLPTIDIFLFSIFQNCLRWRFNTQIVHTPFWKKKKINQNNSSTYSAFFHSTCLQNLEPAGGVPHATFYICLDGFSYIETFVVTLT